MRTSIAGLILGLLLTMGAYGQPPGQHAHRAMMMKGPAPTAFVVKFKVKPGKNAEFERAFAQMMVGVRTKEPGNLEYELFHLAQDPQTYVIFEHYKDPAAVAAHGRSEHGKKLIAALKDLTEGRPQADALVFVRSK